MDTRNTQIMSSSEKNQSSSKERKIYPITGEMLDKAEEMTPIRVAEGLERIKREGFPDWAK